MPTRRDLFQFAAGSAAGLLLTPAPWRLITDTALWSENWPGVPRPARGEIRTRFTHCALCPAGCAVRARSVGDQPVALAGLPGRPLCAFGLAGHQLPYHAGRLAGTPIAPAAAAIAERRRRDAIAVLDSRPGRAASWTYRRAMAELGGIYLTAQSALPAVNLENTKTILSFGAPVLDGWSTPSQVTAARGHFRLIQAEPVESHTAMLADVWLPLRPGSEVALALGIAHLLMQENPGGPFPPVLARAALGYPPAKCAEWTGLPEAQIAAVAGALEPGATLVLAAQERPELVQLNALLGGMGRTVVGRREAPVPASWKSAAAVTPLDAVPDGSIGVLLIDESVGDAFYPWSAIEPKLAPQPVVVTFASTRSGYGRFAQFTLPTAVYPEIRDEIPAAMDSPAAVFRLAAPLVEAPAGTVDPSRFAADLAGLPPGDALRERAGAIHASGRGRLHTYADGKSVPVGGIEAEAFWQALCAGGCWVDETEAAPAASLGESGGAPVTAPSWETRLERGPVSPLWSKLYQESTLRRRV